MLPIEVLMKSLRRLSLVLFAWNLAFACFAQQQPGIVVVNASSRELKRTAHRVRIPVEQLKNARQALKEATDLVKKIDPYPIQQLVNLTQIYAQLDRSKLKAVIESFIHDLRSEAANATTLQRYQLATSAAFALMRTDSDADYDKMLQLIRNWPDPKIAASDTLKSFRESMESQAKSQALNQLANTDPEKAMALLPQPGDSGAYPYAAAGQVAMGLMNSGKKDAAFRLADQIISGFDPNTANAQAIQNYQSFVQTFGRNLDSGRANAAVGSLVTALKNQGQSDGCSRMTLKSGDASVELTCAESRILDIARSAILKPAFTLQTLDSMPGLKSKLDGIGGIDALYSGNQVTTTYTSGVSGSGGGISRIVSSGSAGSTGNPSNLYQELKGKDAATIKSRLKDTSIETMISMAMNAANQDPDFSAIVLEVAEQLLPQVEPLQSRASVLRNLMQAYRQVEGESDPAMLKSGFIIADQLKQEYSEKMEAAGKFSVMDGSGRINMPVISLVTPGDQLEAFLVAELSKDSYESAIRYVRSMENNTLKLQCLLQIAQALSNPNN
jgi:hypothetical protein